MTSPIRRPGWALPLAALACAGPEPGGELRDVGRGSCESVTVELVATAATLTTTEQFLPDGQRVSRHAALHERGVLRDEETELWWFDEDGRARSMTVRSATSWRDGLLEIYDRDERGLVVAEHHTQHGEPLAEITRTFTADGRPETEWHQPLDGGSAQLASWSYTDGRLELFENLNPDTGGMYQRELYTYYEGSPSLDAYVEVFAFGARTERIQRYDDQGRLVSWRLDNRGQVTDITYTYTPQGKVARRTSTFPGAHPEIVDHVYDDDGHLVATTTGFDTDADGEPDQLEAEQTWEWTCW